MGWGQAIREGKLSSHNGTEEQAWGGKNADFWAPPIEIC